MRTFAIAFFLLVAACSQDPGDDNSTSANDSNSANNESNISNTVDMGTNPDQGGNPSDSGDDPGDMPPSSDIGPTTDLAPTDDAGMMVDADDGCVDADQDGVFVECNDFANTPGPDCDDDDADNWASCATCLDEDGDTYFDGCDAYDVRMGPDCDDNDGDNWASCGTCADADNDQYFVDCDAYDTRMGPDCNDGARDINPGETEVPNNGDDDDCNPNTPDAVCDYIPVPANDPESGLAAGMTAEHNRWRVRVGVAPLQWNPTLAASAAAYASQCIWQHDQNRSPDAGFNYVGENLYLSAGMPSNGLLLNAVDSWADERFDYDYGDVIVQNPPAAVGHYTQIVWDNTTDVGCGYAYCSSIQGRPSGGTIVACRYGPGGNYLNQTPYDFSTGACLDLDNDDVWQGNDPDDTDRSTP